MTNCVDKRQIAETFLLGLGTRDWGLLRKIMTDDIVWTLPGYSRISGEVRGLEAVVERAQIIVGYGLTFNLNISLKVREGWRYRCITPPSARARFSTNTSPQFAGFVRIGFTRSTPISRTLTW
jgi:hypothetical protein